MAIKLTVILLLLLFAVMQFGGRDVDGGPFAEIPGADPSNVLLAVAPLDGGVTTYQPPAQANTPLITDTRPDVIDLSDAATRQPDPPSTRATPQGGVSAPQDNNDPQSALDMTVMDPAAARNSLTVAQPNTANTPSSLAPQLAPSETITPRLGGTMAEVVGSSVNLRAGPSTGNSVMGRASEGDMVEWISDPAPGWALIKHPDLENEVYMSSQFLRRVAN